MRHWKRTDGGVKRLILVRRTYVIDSSGRASKLLIPRLSAVLDISSKITFALQAITALENVQTSLPSPLATNCFLRAS